MERMSASRPSPRRASGLLILMLVTLPFVGTLFVSPAAAQSGDFIVAVEDPADDAVLNIVPGGDAGAVFDAARLDIQAVKFQDAGADLLVRLNIGVQPSGTGGYMYYVQFDHAGSLYFTCWNVQFTGNTAELTQENVLGCSRFLSGSQVGPGLLSEGVVQAGDDGAYIQWAVPKAAIGSPEDGAEFTQVLGQTWFRGVSACCPGSTTQSQYLWNLADDAPDGGAAATFTLSGSTGASADVNLTAALVSGPGEVFPGEAARWTFDMGLVGNITAESSHAITFEAADLPEGWTAEFAPEDLVLDNATRSAPVELTLRTPFDAPEGDHSFVFRAFMDGAEGLNTTLGLFLGAQTPVQDPKDLLDTDGTFGTAEHPTGIAPGGSYTFTFTSTGTFPFHDPAVPSHGGQVVVAAGSGSATHLVDIDGSGFHKADGSMQTSSHGGDGLDLAITQGDTVVFHNMDTVRHGVVAGAPTGPADSGERTVTPAFLDFLTPAAEAIAFDDVFGDYAELVLAILILLVLIALVLLIVFLVRRDRGEKKEKKAKTPKERKVKPASLETPEEDAPVDIDDEDLDLGEPVIVAADQHNARQDIIPGMPRITLDGLIHEPLDARPGDAMTTTVTLENKSPQGARLRVVLDVDGEMVEQETLVAPGTQRVRVKFPWTAGHGDNVPTLRVYVIDLAR